MKTITQLINPRIRQKGFSTLNVSVEPGRALTISDRHTLTVTVPESDNFAGFHSPDDFEFEALIECATSKNLHRLNKGHWLDLAHSAELAIWPVAVEIDIDTRLVHRIVLRMVATSERVQWAV